MREVNISQLWNRAWDLFKVNWLLFVVLLVSLPSIIYMLMPIAYILLMPVLVRAGYLVARQGQPSFGEVFRDLSSLLKIFVYELTLFLIRWILLRIAPPGWDGLDVLVVASFIFLLLSFFGWAAPYYVLSGQAGIFSAIGQSFSLTTQNFGKVFVAFLSYIGLAILGALLCGAGLLVVILVWHVFMPLLYFALTDEEGASHA